MSQDRKNKAAPADILDRIAGRTVLVAGDIMLDRFVYGEVHRISPESPVPVLTIKNETAMLGGAGNVLSNLAGLGAGARVLAVTGEDDAAARVRALMTERGADAGGLIAVPGRPTTVKTRFLAAHQQLLRTDFENTAPLPASVEREILARAETFLPQAGAVILSDYGKGVLSEAVVAGIIKKANRLGVPVLVDPKKTDYAIYRGASVITPNRKELSEATGLPARSDEEVVRAASALIEKAGIAAVVATRSQDGMTIVRKAKGRGIEDPVHLRTEAREVFDVSGAGDTVIAVIAAALAAGADLAEAAALANAAAGLVVAKVGTAPVRRAELAAALDRGVNSRLAGAPVCGHDEAAEEVARWKARGLRVGFTNGCFDILHPGHVFYLARARERCDRLIVALNADDSVRRLKGQGRPVNALDARAAVLAGLSSVDMVVPFGSHPAEDDKPVRLIERLRPSIYFKGGDYTESGLPEAPVVRAYGGEVAIMPLQEGHSTTGTIKKLKGKAA